MKKESSYIKVDHNTLFAILNETVKKLIDPENMYENTLPVYTIQCYTLRASFLEPLLHQTIDSNKKLKSAIDNRLKINPQFKLTYKQYIYVILNYNKSIEDVIFFIENINNHRFPYEKLTADENYLYNGVNSLNSAIHNKGQQFSRSEFIEGFYYCYFLYKKIHNDFEYPNKFSNIKDVEDYLYYKFTNFNKSKIEPSENKNTKIKNKDNNESDSTNSDDFQENNSNASNDDSNINENINPKLNKIYPNRDKTKWVFDELNECNYLINYISQNSTIRFENDFNLDDILIKTESIKKQIDKNHSYIMMVQSITLDNDFSVEDTTKFESIGRELNKQKSHLFEFVALIKSFRCIQVFNKSKISLIIGIYTFIFVLFVLVYLFYSKNHSNDLGSWAEFNWSNIKERIFGFSFLDDNFSFESLHPFIGTAIKMMVFVVQLGVVPMFVLFFSTNSKLSQKYYLLEYSVDNHKCEIINESFTSILLFSISIIFLFFFFPFTNFPILSILITLFFSLFKIIDSTSLSLNSVFTFDNKEKNVKYIEGYFNKLFAKTTLICIWVTLAFLILSILAFFLTI